ncbi:hypothetical protein ACQCSX_23375 (plasmid) [Pseudarthrobacter sp. P1]|uniref:hypothetical protein n=1 Tax=Pseudarthrobacter sp. P1 TaxID=3418418 RepID=UPI003CE79F03
MDFYRLPMFGAPFEHVETYFEYEGLRTFAMRSTRLSLYYIVNCVDENDDEETLTYLFVAVGADRFAAIRSGLVPFREAFTDPVGQGLYAALWDFKKDDYVSPELRLVVPSEVPDAWLPAKEARLRLPTPTAPEFDLEELQRLSANQGRTIFALEVESHASAITEFPTKYSGRLQVAVQGQIDALAQEYSAARVQDIQTSVIGLRAASFVVVIAVDSSDTLFELRDLTQHVFKGLQSLLSVAGDEDPETMIAALAPHTRRVRLRFRDILEPLVKTGSGLGFAAALVGEEGIVKTSYLTPRAVKTAFEAIENVTPVVQPLTIPRAILTGLTLRTKRFELTDAASMKTYKGSMTEEALTQADGLAVGKSSFVTAVIRSEISFMGDDAEADSKYILERIQPIETAAKP